MLIHNFVIVKSTENFKDPTKINCKAVIHSCNCNPQKTEKNDLYKGCIQLARNSPYLVLAMKPILKIFFPESYTGISK